MTKTGFLRKLIACLLIAVVLCVSVGAVDYDPNVDYMDRMIKAAINGDQEALEKAVEQRNAKIEGEKMSYEPVSADELINTFEERVGFSLHTDYMSIMVQCALNGDYNTGRAAADKRNIKIAYLGMGYQKISFDDFLLLSKVIYSEAGSSWLSMEWKMAVGEVVLNRVANPAFPNSIQGVIFQRGQYAGASYYASFVPNAKSVEAAVRLCNGERVFNDINVVFQANFRQGHGVARVFYDSLLGNTYFCYL